MSAQYVDSHSARFCLFIPDDVRQVEYGRDVITLILDSSITAAKETCWGNDVVEHLKSNAISNREASYIVTNVSSFATKFKTIDPTSGNYNGPLDAACSGYRGKDMSRITHQETTSAALSNQQDAMIGEKKRQLKCTVKYQVRRNEATENLGEELDWVVTLMSCKKNPGKIEYMINDLLSRSASQPHLLQH